MPLPTVLPAGVVATTKTDPVTGKPATVVMFDNAKINASIENALKAIPPGNNSAVLAFGNLEGAGLTFAHRKGHWTYVVNGKIDWASMDLSAEAAVRFAWGKD